ncbi:MAG: DUF4157 domain-containing protein [Richelia sp. RM2_1_2]|nr:DUF4157 domain-containing protein [Richelia sp. RM2_1_2]
MSWERKVQKKPSWSSSTQAPRESLFKTQGVSKPVEPVEKAALKPIQFRGTDTSHLDHLEVNNTNRPIVTPRVNLSNLQTKLTVGAPGDKYEQEADSMAQKVMSTPDSVVQRMTPGEEEEVRTKPLAANITPLVQREEMSQQEEKELQAKPLGNGTIQREEMPEEKEIQTKRSLQRTTDSSFQAGGNIESQLNSSKGGGSPLADNVRSFMEPRFGTDFSSVRVHTGSEAVQMNRELGAQAFTHGGDVYFAEGKAPGNNDLTAHELTHVVQQGGGVQAKLANIAVTVSNHMVQCDDDEQKYTPTDANYSTAEGTESKVDASTNTQEGSETSFNVPNIETVNEETHTNGTWKTIRDGAAGVAYGTAQGLAPGGFAVPSPMPNSRTFEFFRGAGQIATGVAQTVVGAGGEVIGIGLDATGGGAIAGVPLNVASAAVAANGVTSTIAGVGTIANAMSMNDDDFGNNYEKRGRKGESFRGGSKKDRDKWYGYNEKNFQRWWHREGKEQFGGRDIDDAQQAKEAYEYWESIGKPTIK